MQFYIMIFHSLILLILKIISTQLNHLFKQIHHFYNKMPILVNILHHNKILIFYILNYNYLNNYHYAHFH